MSCKVASRGTKNKQRVKLPMDNKFKFFRISDFFFVPCSWRKWTLHINKFMILYTYLCSHNLLKPYIENQSFHPSPVHDDLSESIHCLRTLVKEWFSILCWRKWSMRALPVMPFVLSNYMVKYTKPFILYIWNQKKTMRYAFLINLQCMGFPWHITYYQLQIICYSQFCLKCVNLNTPALDFKRWNL